jgi:ATP-binding cassette subfamily B (MDR/TAP) protein 1
MWVTVGPARFAVSANLGSTLRVYDRPRENASRENIENIVYGATRLANAHDFITKLPDGYDTLDIFPGCIFIGRSNQAIPDILEDSRSKQCG